MGNLYCVENNLDGDIWNYFDLGKNIVCVNAIGENIQQRLNGCDYDSDSMLITDDKLLVETAERDRQVSKWLTSENVLIFVVRHYEKNRPSDWRIYAPIVNSHHFKDFMLKGGSPKVSLKKMKMEVLLYMVRNSQENCKK